MIYNIYKLTNTINGKVYIGVTNNYKNRMRGHALANNDYLISRAIRKYGWNNFTKEIIYQSYDKDYMYKIAENLFIIEYNSNNAMFGYNMTAGGQGTVGYIPSQETRQKQRNAKIGKELSEEHKQKIGNSHKGQKRSEEARAKMSEKLKGNKHFEGKTFTDDVKFILSEQKAKDYIVISPSGETVTIHNMRKFCLDNGLHASAMCRMLQGYVSHHKGWSKPTI